jgi:prepilin-type N-terminal cleavage/methylation domain-containing protein
MAGRPIAAGARPARGFTLVEILVVIAIIATLVGLVATMIPAAIKKKQVLRTQTLVTGIAAALESLQLDNEQYGKYPPSRTRDMKFGKSFVGKEIGMPNEVNCGIESVFFLLNNPTIQCPQVTSDEELIGNADDDAYRNARGNASDAFAREYLDAWGQPLAYFHSNDYKDPKGLEELQTTDMRKIQVRPKKMSVKAGGGFLGPNSYQIFSVGPDGEQDADDAEEGDDIVFSGR